MSDLHEVGRAGMSCHQQCGLRSPARTLLSYSLRPSPAEPWYVDYVTPHLVHLAVTAHCNIGDKRQAGVNRRYRHAALRGAVRAHGGLKHAPSHVQGRGASSP